MLVFHRRGRLKVAMLDPQLLRLFVLLAQERHFGRAAERASLAQSSASAQLRRLEDIIGAPLFMRNKRAAVQLTDVGRHFLIEARDVLEHLSRAESIGRAMARGEAGSMALGYIFSAVTSGVLPQLLALIRRTMPLVEVQPRQAETPDQIVAVAERRLDVGIVRTRPSYPAGVEAVTVVDEPLLLLVATVHQLADLPVVPAAALASQTFLLPQFNERVGLVETVERLAAASGFAMPGIVRTSDFISAASMAAAGYGVVLAPASLIRSGIAGLTARPIEGFTDRIDTALIWHKEGSPIVHRLSQLVVSAKWLNSPAS